MREIKFRAWLKEDKKMENVKTMDFTDKTIRCLKKNEFINAYLLRRVSFDDVELMQYTGLKDKNGKEIYECDILWDEHNEEYCEVIFECGNFVCNFETNSIDLSDISDELIVRGNIYENKELIGDEE